MNTWFLTLIIIVILIALTIIITNILSMKKIELNCKKLDRNSERYKNNKMKILSKFKLIFIIIYIMEIVFLIFNYFNCCMCGYREFAMIPLIIFFILQVIINFIFFKTIKYKDYNVNFLIKYICINIVFISIMLIFTKTDMDKLHEIN